MASDIEEWLEGLGLGKYTETFTENDVDFRALPHLDREDLKELGVSLGHRKVILAAISKLSTGDDVERGSEVATSSVAMGAELSASSGQAGPHCPFRLVLIGTRPAEEGEHAVAEKLCYMPLEARHYPSHSVLVAAHHLAQVFWV